MKTAPSRTCNTSGRLAPAGKGRKARDPLELELPERRVMLDEQGRIAQIALRERLDAHRVVEDFMIAANVAAAKALEEERQSSIASTSRRAGKSCWR
jgi:exoribonuclease R